MIGNINDIKYKIWLVFIDVDSFDAVVSNETRCLPTPRDVSTGSIVAFCRSKAVTVFGPIVSMNRCIWCFNICYKRFLKLTDGYFCII